MAKQGRGMFARSIALAAEHARQFGHTRFRVEQGDFRDCAAIVNALAHHVMGVGRGCHLREVGDAKDQTLLTKEKMGSEWKSAHPLQLLVRAEVLKNSCEIAGRRREK